jgi:hypothetical protein
MRICHRRGVRRNGPVIRAIIILSQPLEAITLDHTLAPRPLIPPVYSLDSTDSPVGCDLIFELAVEPPLPKLSD